MSSRCVPSGIWIGATHHAPVRRVCGAPYASKTSPLGAKLGEEVVAAAVADEADWCRAAVDVDAVDGV